MNDLRFAGRQLAKAPGFTIAAVATLALGIGANTAMFSLVNGILLRPLPYEEPGRLVHVWEAPRPGQRNSVSPGVFSDWREHATTLESLAAFSFVDWNLTGEGGPERVNGVRISASGLRILRARPVLGRLFARDEDQPGKDKVVVLTDRIWRRRFGGDAGIVGRGLRLNAESHTVVGVLPRGFLPWEKPDFVVPLAIEPPLAANRGNHYLRVIGRLAPGVSVAQAEADLSTVSERFKRHYPPFKKQWGVTVVAMQEQLTGDIRPALLVLLGAVGLVLLIAAANVANLMLARSSSRRKEIAVRLALGATRGRVIRQLLAESVLLSLGGAVLGVALAYGGVAAVRQATAANVPRVQEIGVDLYVLGFALVVSIATGLAFGLVPALQASRPDLRDELKEAGRGSVAGGRNRARSSLIVSELALALVLLAGAGLLLNSFVRLAGVPPGFDPRHALTMQLSLPEKRHPDAAARAAFFGRVLERVATIPGVESAAVSGGLPIAAWPADTLVKIAGRAGGPDAGYSADFDYCSPDYFRAMGIPVVKGRAFDARDTGTAPRVAIVNEAFVREHFPGDDPLGMRIEEGRQGWEIVGVIGDVRSRGLAERVRPMFYRPLAFSHWANGRLIVRARAAPLSLSETVRKAILEVDPDLPVSNIRSLEEVVAASVGQRRLMLLLLALFAAAALLLAAVGLYGVVAYTVTERTREIGIRMALGAQRADVLGMVLLHGARLGGLGIVLGAGVALAVTRVLASQLYDVKPTDPATLAGVALLLFAAALLASWLPARRAASLEPMGALR